MSDLRNTSKFISLILRHKPETIGITLDEHGWANVDELIEGISKSRPFNMDILEEIVRTDEKQRYSFNDDKTLIRANQGCCSSSGRAFSTDRSEAETILFRWMWNWSRKRRRRSSIMVPVRSMFLRLTCRGAGRPVDVRLAPTEAERRPDSQIKAICASFFRCRNREKGRQQARPAGHLHRGQRLDGGGRICLLSVGQ